MIEDSTKYRDLSKEMIVNLMQFAENMNIKNLILLIDIKNKEYVKVLQGMMTIGFKIDENMKVCKIAEKDYKILKMIMKKEEIEEIPF